MKIRLNLTEKYFSEKVMTQSRSEWVVMPID